MVLAVTGEVGAGKSTAAKLLAAALGAPLIDADAIVASLWKTGAMADLASGRWGVGVLNDDGTVRHAEVAARIFTDKAEYAWLMSVIHPLVMGEIDRRAEEAGALCVAEIPLLFESGRRRGNMRAVFVMAPRCVRLARCTERGWDEEELTRREGFFLPARERAAMSDYVIDNGGSLDALNEAVRKISLDFSGSEC
ncbi:MAG: dephospho-CoA kinase [Synergistaceae bacterium]|jgi:dephospho-CoA kinase|nr:dephospho-CoA kinase [Synergistaceae bacterium]